MVWKWKERSSGFSRNLSESCLSESIAYIAIDVFGEQQIAAKYPESVSQMRAHVTRDRVCML